MRYSTLASTVLLAVATAPALAHPVTIRATEDASMVSERELQDVLMGRGYYDDILSRDLEARKDPDKAVPKQATASAQGQRRMTMGQWRQRQAGREEEKGKRLPNPSHPHPNGGAGQGAGGGQHRSREYDLDGGLFGRATEDASMVERALQDALMERGYYDDLLSRDLEARKNPEKPKPDAAQRRKELREGQLRAFEHGMAQGHDRPTQIFGQGTRPGPSRPQQSGGAGQRGGGQHRPREYDLDGELFGRTTEDASMVERELQDALMERGYYDDLLSRDLEARKSPEKPKQGAASAQSLGHLQEQNRVVGGFLRGQMQARRREREQMQSLSPSTSGPSHPHPNGGAGQGARGQHRPREYDLDGGLFERGFEADELD
ncbi:uncharacterized protein B0H18DRAFT_504560 [Fomitopsis serialis]|uniref:uncharacterized protein n=1 Tax=Fomitopsis serialis TaxID=139415 RepID=UPI0020075BB2|nr:uncharacterized protein B0H18DRAFT_504560 [Neoantrodia serialis]KAH9910225.1 hypothetical protein B0H18DRAFT_504560 [Neoantrodia serialis]